MLCEAATCLDCYYYGRDYNWSVATIPGRLVPNRRYTVIRLPLSCPKEGRIIRPPLYNIATSLVGPGHYTQVPLYVHALPTHLQ